MKNCLLKKQTVLTLFIVYKIKTRANTPQGTNNAQIKNPRRRKRKTFQTPPEIVIINVHDFGQLAQR